MDTLWGLGVGSRQLFRRGKPSAAAMPHYVYMQQDVSTRHIRVRLAPTMHQLNPPRATSVYGQKLGCRSPIPSFAQI